MLNASLTDIVPAGSFLSVGKIGVDDVFETVGEGVVAHGYPNSVSSDISFSSFL